MPPSSNRLVTRALQARDPGSSPGGGTSCILQHSFVCPAECFGAAGSCIWHCLLKVRKLASHAGNEMAEFSSVTNLGIVQFGRTRVLGSRGRGFKSLCPDQNLIFSKIFSIIYIQKMRKEP